MFGLRTDASFFNSYNVVMDKTKISGNFGRGFDYIGVSACAVVHDGNGNILLMKRGAKARDEHGRWDITGGGIEFGHTIKETLQKELMEELCVKPINIKFLTAYDAFREYEGKKTHWVALIHAVKVHPDKVKLGEPDKFDEIGWFNSSTLPSPLHSQFEKSKVAAIKAGILH